MEDNPRWCVVHGILYKPLYAKSAAWCTECVGYGGDGKFLSLCKDLPDCDSNYIWAKVLPITKRIRHPKF